MSLPSKLYGLESVYQVVELLEQIAGVVRSRTRLGVVLHAEGRPVHSEPLDRRIVEVDVREAGFRVLDRSRVDGKTVVLAGDLDARMVRPLHGVVPAPVAEGQLERQRSQGEPEDLVAETDSEHGDLAEKIGDGVDRVGHRPRAPRAVRQEPPVVSATQNLFG